MAKRVLLKISGEAFCDEGKLGFSRSRLDMIAGQIHAVRMNYQIAVLLGGGNILRGSRAIKELELKSEVPIHAAGMVATVINAQVFQVVLRERGVTCEIFTAPSVCVSAIGKPYASQDVKGFFEGQVPGSVALLAGGTGEPGFTTDTAMVLRAYQIGAQAVLKGTKVNGIYSRDPQKYPDAQHIPRIGYKDYVAQDLEVMDATAVTMARDHKLPIKVFDIFAPGNLKRVLDGEEVGSIIEEAS